MRFVDHLAVDPHHASRRIFSESIDYFLRVREFVVRWGKGGVDDVDVLWMDYRLAQKAVETRRNGLFLQAVEIVDIGIDGVDRDHAGRTRRDQAEVARQEIRAVELAVGAIAHGTDRGAQIFAAPHQTPQPLAAARE